MADKIFDTIQGLRILVTRPDELSAPLCQLITHSGGIAITFPAISIEPLTNTEPLLKTLKTLKNFDMAIFISPTAVIKAFQYIDHLPDSLKLAVIGDSTQSRLIEHGYTASILPDKFDSQGLLEHAELQADAVAGKNILILRGEGGRPVLRDILSSRGAQVEYAELYRRCMPKHDNELAELLDEVDLITVSSNEGLNNLYALCNTKNKLTSLPLVTPGKRATDLAQKLGFGTIIQADNATDQACMDAILGLSA